MIIYRIVAFRLSTNVSHTAWVVDWILLASAVAAALATWQSFFPFLHRRLRWPSFFVSWLTGELAMFHLLMQVGAASIAVAVVRSWPGWLAVGLFSLSVVGLLVLQIRAGRARAILQAALESSGVAKIPGPQYPRHHAVLPALAWQRKDIRVERNIEFSRSDGEVLHLDVFTAADARLPAHEHARGGGVPTAKASSFGGAPHRGRPVLLSVHGGAWVLGHREAQGIPLLGHMAARGWVGFNADYRLSPRWSLPTHLVDLKRAVAWIRQHASEYDLDAEFIAVAGGSAGAHLASLLALTANDPEYQPGFEHVDTRVQAVVCTYGVYDLTLRNGVAGPELIRFLEAKVIQRGYANEPEVFARMSPIERVHADAPAFFVIQGTRDSITPMNGARAFVQRLRSISQSPVVYAELPGAQHAFDIFPSVRAIAAVDAAAQFLTDIYQRHLVQRAAKGCARAPSNMQT